MSDDGPRRDASQHLDCKRALSPSILTLVSTGWRVALLAKGNGVIFGDLTEVRVAGAGQVDRARLQAVGVFFGGLAGGLVRVLDKDRRRRGLTRPPGTWIESIEMNAERLQELGAAYTAAWNRLDPAGVASFHNETSFLKVNDAEPAIGHEAIGDVAQGFMTAFPDMVLEMDSILATATGAEYHWTYSGTNTGPGGTGMAVRFSGYEEWTLGEDGLIAGALGHFDEAEYGRQLEVGVGGS